jgi:hypothetical protein
VIPRTAKWALFPVGCPVRSPSYPYSLARFPLARSRHKSLSLLSRGSLSPVPLSPAPRVRPCAHAAFSSPFLSHSRHCHPRQTSRHQEKPSLNTVVSSPSPCVPLLFIRTRNRGGVPRPSIAEFCRPLLLCSKMSDLYLLFRMQLQDLCMSF